MDAFDDKDGSDSEVSMRCEFVDSMAAESRSVHAIGRRRHQRGLGSESLRNRLVMCSFN
jgi:hypothetical protein